MANPQYRVVVRCPDTKPVATYWPLRDAAERYFRSVVGLDRFLWVEFHGREHEGAAWKEIDWRGVRLVDLDGTPIQEAVA